jgi:hypothetical protein
MTEINVTQDEPFIRVTITGTNDEPMRENRREAEAARAAKKLLGAKVSYLSGGGALTSGTWELSYTYVPEGYKAPPRTD